jgi:hypothetical protein
MGILPGIFDGKGRRGRSAGRGVMGGMLFPTIATPREARGDMRIPPIAGGEALPERGRPWEQAGGKRVLPLAPARPGGYFTLRS